jgi:lysylphosphatidylglycerol synthetase-like protein (DUF2156 family)
MSGMFDKEEWDFECRRDEKAAEELEQIKAVRDKWHDLIIRFTELANAEAEKEILKLKEKWK